MHLERELSTAVWLARGAGATLRRHQCSAVRACFKAGGELVTAADLEANRIIQVGLRAAFPSDAFFSEETVDSPARLANGRVWIVDPLDSTSNFLAKGDEYCVSIGLCVESRAALGVVYNPARDQLFAGYVGAGMTLNGTRVSVSDASQIEGAQISVSRKELQAGLQGRASVKPLTAIASMAYKLARVAAGLDDAVFSLKRRKEWGTCAGMALIAAAGGRVTALDGNNVSFNRPQGLRPLGLIAAGPQLHRLLLAALRLSAAREEVVCCHEPL